MMKIFTRMLSLAILLLLTLGCTDSNGPQYRYQEGNDGGSGHIKIDKSAPVSEKKAVVSANEPVNGTIANLDESHIKYYGWSNVIASGYINLYFWSDEHHIRLCENPCPKEGICINVGFGNYDLSQDTIRRLKRLSLCDSIPATVLIHTNLPGQSSTFYTTKIEFN